MEAEGNWDVLSVELALAALGLQSPFLGLAGLVGLAEVAGSGLTGLG